MKSPLQISSWPGTDSFRRQELRPMRHARDAGPDEWRDANGFTVQNGDFTWKKMLIYMDNIYIYINYIYG